MDNANLFIFVAYVSMAVCMDLPFHQLQQKSVLYCSSSTCMRCAYSECTVGQSCTLKYDIFQVCLPQKCTHLHFKDEYPFSQTSKAGKQEVEKGSGMDVLLMKNFSFSNFGVYLCDSMGSEISAECLVLMPHHQATVTINGITKIYNGSCYQHSMDHFVEVEENNFIEIDCQPGGEPESNCSIHTDISKSFWASHLHSPCSIKCKLPIHKTLICTVNIKVDVSTSFDRHFSGATERPLLATPSTNLSSSSKKCLQDRERGEIHPLDNMTIVFIALIILIIFLLIVLICLMVLLLLKRKPIRYRRHSRSIELDSATRESVYPTITHTYAMKEYFGEGTPFRNDKVTNIDNQMLRFTMDSSQSNSTFQGLAQYHNSSIPGMVTPYAVTCLFSSDNSLTHINHLSKSSGVDVSTYLDLSLETSVRR